MDFSFPFLVLIGLVSTFNDGPSSQVEAAVASSVQYLSPNFWSGSFDGPYVYARSNPYASPFVNTYTGGVQPTANSVYNPSVFAMPPTAQDHSSSPSFVLAPTGGVWSGDQSYDKTNLLYSGEIAKSQLLPRSNEMLGQSGLTQLFTAVPGSSPVSAIVGSPSDGVLGASGHVLGNIQDAAAVDAAGQMSPIIFQAPGESPLVGARSMMQTIPAGGEQLQIAHIAIDQQGQPLRDQNGRVQIVYPSPGGL